MLDTILIIALLTVLFYMLKEIIYKDRISNIQLKEVENLNKYKGGAKSYCNKHKIGNVVNMDNYNTIRQRNVRREIKANKEEKKEKHKKQAKKLKCKKEKTNREINDIRRKEFIISLDKEINTILAELILIKKNNEIFVHRLTTDLSKIKIQNANKLIKMIDKQEFNDIDRIYVKKELLVEYIDILSNFINNTSIVETQYSF